MSWATDLQRIAKKGGQNLGMLAKAVKVELFSGIVEDTRVDTGRLKGNWQVQENSPAGVAIDRLDPTGAQVKMEIDAGATEAGKTYFTNHLPYAKTYEDKDAMVARNIARVRRIVRDEARKLK